MKSKSKYSKILDALDEILVSERTPAFKIYYQEVLENLYLENLKETKPQLAKLAIEAAKKGFDFSENGKNITLKDADDKGYKIQVNSDPQGIQVVSTILSYFPYLPKNDS